MAITQTRDLRIHAFRAWRATHRVGLHEAVMVAGAFLVYFLVRASVDGRAVTAFANGRDVIAFEKRLGLYHELAMQGWIIDHYALIKAMNWIYFWGHMPVVIAFAVWLFIWHRPTYTLMRNAFLASGAITVVIYATYPVAPPRLFPLEGFIDTMAVHDRVSYNAQEVGAFVNQYAAIPSLHFGWSLLLGGAVAVVTRHPVMRTLGILWPILMFFSVVLTGNHFIVDAVAGALVCAGGLGVAFALKQSLGRMRPARR